MFIVLFCCNHYTPLNPRFKKGGILFYLCLSIHPSFSLSVCPSHEYFCRIFLGNYNAKISEIWFQGLYKLAIPFNAFSDSSLDNFLFTEHLYLFTHDGQVENFCHIFPRNYNTRISEFWL